MAERPAWPTDADLERALVDLGRRVAYPPTPDLRQAVRRRIVAGGPPRRPSRATIFPMPRVLAVAALALLLLIGAVLVASPEAHTAIADRLGLRGVTIFHVPSVPSPSPAATPVSVGLRPGLGERLSTLAEAQARVPYRVLAPTAPELTTPDEIYVGGQPPGGQVALIYRARSGLPETTETGVGLLLTQFRGAIEPGFLFKGVGPESRVEEVTVNGVRGYWIEGKPHLLIYRDQSGRISEEQVRLAANVLLWEQGELTLRIEGALSRDEALRIAASVR